jgi:hypothetical protein
MQISGIWGDSGPYLWGHEAERPAEKVLDLPAGRRGETFMDLRRRLSYHARVSSLVTSTVTHNILKDRNSKTFEGRSACYAGFRGWRGFH